MSFKQRQKNLRQELSESNYRAFLLSSENDIFYYTGYRSSGNCMLLVSPKNLKLFVSRLEGDTEKLTTARIVVTDKKAKPLYKELKKYKTVGFDESNLKTWTYLQLKKKAKLKPAAEWIKKPRQVKEPGEISLLKKSARITKKAFKIRLTGRAENRVAKDIRKIFLEKGDGDAFPPIVASGKNSAVIHHWPGKNKIRAKDLTIVDIGARVKGYCADFTRTFCPKPGKREKITMENMQSIHDTVLDMVQEGVKYKELQDAFEREMEKTGYKVKHMIGHGIGLSTHEPAPEVLKKNSVITVEPGVYIRGFGGCRIENSVLVKKDKGEIL